MPNGVVFSFSLCADCTTLLSLPLTITGLQSEKENHTQLQISKTQKGKQRLQLFIDPLSCGARNVCVVDGLHYTVVSSDFRGRSCLLVMAASLWPMGTVPYGVHTPCNYHICTSCSGLAHQCPCKFSWYVDMHTYTPTSIHASIHTQLHSPDEALPSLMGKCFSMQLLL